MHITRTPDLRTDPELKPGQAIWKTAILGDIQTVAARLAPNVCLILIWEIQIMAIISSTIEQT